jgi:hypothetical protein
MSQEALRELYRDVWPKFAALPTDQGISHPLFVSLGDQYFAAERKVMIVGQETNSWYGLLGQEKLGDDPVGKVMQWYEDFNLGARYRSPFWDAARKLRRLLSTAEGSVGLAWSNLYPCDQRKGRPAEQQGQSLLDLRILPREIGILKPDAVIFFTGPQIQYVAALDSLFRSVQHFDAGAPSGFWIQRLEHAGLPAASFRTYHPASLRRQKKWAALDTLAGLIRAKLAA